MNLLKIIKIGISQSMRFKGLTLLFPYSLSISIVLVLKIINFT